MKRIGALVFLAFLFAVTAYAQENPLSKLGWQFSGDGVIGDKATIKIPEGYAFLGAADTKKFMELNENLTSGREYLFAPKDLSWFAVFEFSPVGYVKDDEKIDADSVLNTVRKSTEKGNEERRKRGWGTLSIQGWRFQPQYDKNAKLLEWAFVATDDRTNAPIINYNTRLLGRTGVMQVVLVSSPEALDQSVGSLKKALGGYDFTRGEKYAEFRPGDHVTCSPEIVRV